MIYGLSIYSDGSIELFNIRDSMLDGIIEDIKLSNSNSKVSYMQNQISLHTKNFEVTYFYDKEDRKQKVIEFMNVH